MPVVSALLALMCLTFAKSACCKAPDRGRRSPVPEPLLTETATDIDGSDAGEYEVELNGSELRALRGGAYTLQTSTEVEWLVTRNLGLRLEPTFSKSRSNGTIATDDELGAHAATSWKLLQDAQRDIYLQPEAAVRLPWGFTALPDPGESALPVTLDLRGAVRLGRWTFRSSIGAATGGASAHVPIRASAAVLTGFASTERFGFWGFEADIDECRLNPTVLALNLVPHLGPMGLPFRFGLAVPWVVGVNGGPSSAGLFLRILFESAREFEYGKTGI